MPDSPNFNDEKPRKKDTTSSGVSGEESFVVKAKNMGLKPGIDIDNVHDLLAEWEIEDHLEVTQKLEERLSKSTQNKQTD